MIKNFIYYALNKYSHIIFYNKYHWIIYLIFFIIIFLENGILVTTFLPGDSLLLLTGTLAYNNIINLFLVLILLTIAAWLGSWVSFLQGKWLKNKKLVNYRFLFIPKKYQKKAYRILNKYGSLALLIGRFIIFIRTILPMIIGLSNIHSKLFQLFNFFSAFFWVSTLIFIGYLLNILIINVSLKYLITLLIAIIPIIIFIISLIVIILITLKKMN
ncbi:MAG: DedA family protein [Candidatus Lightella neohaematopini]|nr:DedA family protein [Candidatus Lightella neohaematopini]MCV2529047.1 DedA family protein [Candidatus Lightella neohaematopini]